MLKLFRSIILIFILSANCGVAIADELAAEDIYQIEVIFFEHTDPQRFESEEWPKFVGNLDTRNTIPLQSTDLLVKVEPNKRLLNSEANILRHSKEQRVIEQVYWNQPLSANVKSIPVYIQAGKDQKEIEAVISLKPIRSQFEISVDAIYHYGEESREFRITRDIKAKKKEMFYLDHPIIGMMIMVTPVEVPGQS